MRTDPFLTVLTAITGNHADHPWFARSMLPSAAQHFWGQAGGTTEKAVMVVRVEREHCLYNRSYPSRSQISADFEGTKQETPKGSD